MMAIDQSDAKTRTATTSSTGELFVVSDRHRKWTVEELLALPGENKREIVDGELLIDAKPIWDHDDAVQRHATIFADYLRTHPLGRLKIVLHRASRRSESAAS